MPDDVHVVVGVSTLLEILAQATGTPQPRQLSNEVSTLLEILAEKETWKRDKYLRCVCFNPS